MLHLSHTRKPGRIKLFAGLIRVLASVLITFSSGVWAVPNIDELSSLSFGVLAVPDNSTTSSLFLSQSGQVEIIGSLIVVSNGSVGSLSLTGFPANVGVEIDGPDAPLSVEGFGDFEELVVTGYDFGSPRTNSEGELILSFGGTVTTSGNGASYEDALYEGSVTLRFTYWNPDASDYSSVSKTVTIRSELRTGFNIEQIQALHFGTLFARTSLESQASTLVTPEGDSTVINESDALIAPLSEPTPGIISIVGAAINRELIVTPQSTSVLLTRTQNPSSAPHFVLSDLTTTQSNEGRTDEQGNMEIRVGGKLTTEATDEVTVYPDGRYSGTYEIDISY